MSCYATAVIILDTLTQEGADAMPFTGAFVCQCDFLVLHVISWLIMFNLLEHLSVCMWWASGEVRICFFSIRARNCHAYSCFEILSYWYNIYIYTYIHTLYIWVACVSSSPLWFQGLSLIIEHVMWWPGHEGERAVWISLVFGRLSGLVPRTSLLRCELTLVQTPYRRDLVFSRCHCSHCLQFADVSAPAGLEQSLFSTKQFTHP